MLATRASMTDGLEVDGLANIASTRYMTT